MKRKWSLAVVLALVCVMLLGIGVAADTVAEGTCGDDLTWVLDDAGVLTISGEGEMEDYWDGYKAPWYSYSNSITSITINEGVTSIGYEAFKRCTGITSIEFPESLTSIGNYTFYGCTGLTSIEFPESLTSISYYAFYGCTGLTSIDFPESLTSIDGYAFYGCTGLTSIDFPESLTSIGNSAFYGCTGLTSIEFPESLTSIGYYAFNACRNLSEIKVNSNIHIDDSTFTNTSLQTVAISNAVEELSYVYGVLAISTITEFNVEDTDGTGFVSMEGVLYSYDDYLETYTLVRYPAAKEGTEYTIIDDTETINSCAFNSCSNLERINIPDTVQTISEDAFMLCENLSTLQWGAGITTVASTVYSGSPITRVIMPEKAVSIPTPSTVLNYEVTMDTGIGYRDIDGVLFYYDAETEQLTLSEYPDGRTDTEYIIPEGTNVIGNKAFYYDQYPYENTCLTNVIFPESVHTISAYSFKSCTGLVKLILNEGLTNIGSYAFNSCVSLKEIQFPSTITSIGSRAFYGCTYLKEVSFPESVQSISWDAFNSCTALRRTYFYGNTPYCYSDTFENTHSTFTIYYIEGKSGWTSPTWNGYNTATFVPEGYSLTPKSTSTYIFTDATITNVPAGTTVSTFAEQFDNAGISLTTATGTSLSDTALVGTGCVVYLTVDGTVVDSRMIIVTGDMDGDGLTSSTDLTLLQQYYRGYAVTIAYPAAADLNGDGKMTRADAMVLARQLAGWKDALTPPSDVIIID